MNHRDADAFRLFTREWHERRVREADMERFAREIRASGRRRPLWMAASFLLAASHRPPLDGVDLVPHDSERNPDSASTSAGGDVCRDVRGAGIKVTGR